MGLRDIRRLFVVPALAGPMHRMGFQPAKAGTTNVGFLLESQNVN